MCQTYASELVADGEGEGHGNVLEILTCVMILFARLSRCRFVTEFLSCTVDSALSTPSSRPIAAQEAPERLRVAIREQSTAFRGLPSFFPLA